MCNAPLISIIVPVYNTEEYIGECIESILNQTYTNFELILVNDGSTDDSLDICRQYEGKDMRVKILNKTNGGVSSARNFGLREATGDFISFVDSDDIIRPDYLEYLVSNVEDDIDFIQSGILYFDNISRKVIGKEDLQEQLCIERSTSGGCFKLATMPLITSPVSKLYRTSIINNNKVFFVENITYGEDRDFNLKFISYVQKAKSIDYIGYYYRKAVVGSLSTNSNYIQRLRWDLDYWNNLNSYFIKCGYKDEPSIQHYLLNRLFNFYNDNLLNWGCLEERTIKEIREVLEKFFSTDTFMYLIKNINVIEIGRVDKTIFKVNSLWLYIMFYFLKFKTLNK